MKMALHGLTGPGRDSETDAKEGEDAERRALSTHSGRPRQEHVHHCNPFPTI
jgi:hypothetical protein